MRGRLLESIAYGRTVETETFLKLPAYERCIETETSSFGRNHIICQCCYYWPGEGKNILRLLI